MPETPTAGESCGGHSARRPAPKQSNVQGHDGWRKFWAEFRAIFDSLDVVVEELHDCGERVVALHTFNARGRDGIEVRREIEKIWTFRGQRAVRLEGYAQWGEALEAAGRRDSVHR